MKRFLCLVLSFLSITGLLSGCVQEVDPEAYLPTGEALIMEGEDPYAEQEVDDGLSQQLTLMYYPERSMNPLVATDFTNRALFPLIYQGLFFVDEDYNAVPILCKNYRVSADNRTYTFYLENARFTDGSPVTALDVVATYEQAMATGYYSGRFTYLDRVEIAQDGGIDFYLTTPYENFPLLLDVPILKADELEAPNPKGTGPYLLVNQLTGAYLQRNRTWWCSSPDLVVTAGSIPLKEAESAAQIRDQFEFSDVGLVCADPCTFNYADFRCDFELWDCDNGILMYLGCNILYSEGDLFLKRNLRSTLTYAIDRNKINEEVFRGFGRPTTLAADPNSPYYIPSLAERYEYRPLKFVEALGGYWITKPVRLLVNSDDRLRLATARKIAEMLTEHGMTTVTIEKSTQDYLAHIRTANYELFLGKTRLSATMDLSQFFKPWGENSYNGITDPATLDLCKAALDNHGNYYTLLEHVAEDARIVPIMFYGYSIYGTRGLLSDLRPSRDTVFFYTLGKTMDDIQLPTYYT